jgi:transposase-like protein
MKEKKVVQPIDPELKELVEKMVKTDEVRAIIDAKKPQSFEDVAGKNGIAAEMTRQLMQECLNAEMDDFLGFKKHKSPAYYGEESNGSRNGSYKRKLRASDGLVELEIPRDRDGNFKPKTVPKRRQISSTIENKIIGLYALGTSTRDIAEYIEEEYGFNVSESFVSDVTDRVLNLAKQWQTRALQNVYTICYLDAIHISCRENNKVIKKAVYIVLGYDQEGKKEILGEYISAGQEGAKYWLTIIQDLKNRGVNDIFIACVDGLNGFSEAINAVFPNTIVQRCVIHAIRNSLKYIPNKFAPDFMEDLKKVYKADTKQEAEENLKNLQDNWSKKYPMAVNVWINNWTELSQYFDWTGPIRKMIYTTNAIESFNSVLRKYTKNKRSFPSDDALLKALYIATEKATEKWEKSRSDWPTILNQFAIQFEGRLEI